MHDEPTGVRAALQSPERTRCPACQQVKPRPDFATTLTGQFLQVKAGDRVQLANGDVINLAADTAITGGGTGFMFHDLTPDALANTIGWALSTWHDRPHHVDAMRRRAMTQDFSWDRAAREYERLYLAAYARRRGHRFA